MEKIKGVGNALNDWEEQIEDSVKNSQVEHTHII